VRNFLVNHQVRILGIYIFFIIVLVISFFHKALFFMGGALINVGILVQGFETDYNFAKKENRITPDEVLEEVVIQNNVSSLVKEFFPTNHHPPLVVIVLCMDSRISTEELLGDTRDFYYIIRTAGSVIRDKEMEMIELAVVEKNAKLVILTEHTDCAAEKIAASETKSKIYPSISRAIHDRQREIAKFLQRPQIQTRIQNHTLLVKKANIDTNSNKMILEDI
jgi:carbonic anhydrase